MKKKILVALLVVSMFFSACSTKENVESQKAAEEAAATEAPKATEAAAEATQAVEATGKEAKDVVVRYICLTKGIPYFDPIIAGMKESVEAQGATFQETAPDTSDATAQIPLIEAAVQDGVDVICISPSDADALCATFDKAKEAGVIVLCVNDDISGNEDRRDGAVMSSNYDDLAVQSFEAFAEEMGYAGEFVVLSSKTGTPFQENQISFYKKVMEGDPTKYANMKLLEVLYGNDEATKSLTEAESAIQKYPELKGIMAPTSVAIIAAAQAVENAGKSGAIIVNGTGTPNQCADYLANGTMKSAFLWDTKRTGKVSGEIAVAVATGAFKLAPGEVFKSPEYGDIAVGDKNLISAGPPLKLTAENVKDYNF